MFDTFPLNCWYLRRADMRRKQAPRTQRALTPQPAAPHLGQAGGPVSRKAAPRPAAAPTFHELPVQRGFAGRHLLLHPRAASSSCVGRVLSRAVLPTVTRLLRSSLCRGLFWCGHSLQRVNVPMSCSAGNTQGLSGEMCTDTEMPLDRKHVPAPPTVTKDHTFQLRSAVF